MRLNEEEKDRIGDEDDQEGLAQELKHGGINEQAASSGSKERPRKTPYLYSRETGTTHIMRSNFGGLAVRSLPRRPFESHWDGFPLLSAVKYASSASGETTENEKDRSMNLPPNRGRTDT